MSSDSTFRPLRRPSSGLAPVVPAPAGLNKGELFDHIAREHDGFAFTPEDAPRLVTLHRRLGNIVGARIVEPGCGSGHLTAQLAAWTGPLGQIVAFDPSAGMIERTRARTTALPQVAVHHAALETLDLPAAAFDAVVCFRVWPHFDDDDAALAVVARWLKPGGRLLIVHWDGREKLAAIHASHHSVAADVFPPREHLEAAFARHGFTLRTWIDSPEEIFIEAMR